jgi:transcriptional/translational regulatory protein YebC/TACO1
MELALELGADDIETGDEAYEIYTAVEDFAAVQEELEKRGLRLAAKELAMVPQTYLAVPPDRVGQVLRLMEALEDHDDVQHVWANLDLDEKAVAASSG